jgi:PAS domain S-box-containing protein
VNEAYCRFFKQEREALIGSSFLHSVAEEHREAILRKIESLTPEQPVATSEQLVLMPNGTERWCEWTDRGRFDDNGELIELHSTGRDIHERKQVREALQASEQRFRDLFQNSPDAIFVEDLDGVVLDVNPMACRLHGLERKELIGRSFVELVPHQLREAARRDFDHIAKGRVAAIEGFSFSSDGRSIPVGIRARHIDYAGRPALLLHVRDVTEQRQAEEALRESEERYRALFESSLDPIYTSRIDGSIVDINAAAVKLFEFDSRERLLGANVREFYRDPEERDALLAEIAKTGYVRDHELQLVSRTGKALTALLTATAILDENEAVAGFRGILRDVTEQRMLESQFRQAQKMEAVGRLAGGVAHDFNNLLTVITGYSELCLEQTPAEDPRREELLEIQGASERAAKLTRQLLAFSRQQVLRPRVLDLNSVVGDFEKLLRRTIGEDIRFETSLASDLGKVRVDPGQIEQVLMNLAINARDAMPGGGRLFLETENAYLDEHSSTHTTTMETGSYVVLMLGDTGCGMDEETRNRIFEPFFTTKQGRGGTGLGLATVYGIVKQSGGYIWVYSEPEQGTVFKIYFPEIREEIDQPPTTVQELDKDLVGGTILVVEDELPVRSLVVRVLEDQGFRVLATDDPEEAVRILEHHQGPLKLLITDLVMPGMSGLALLEHLVENRPDTRAIMMSGYSKRSRFQGTGLPAGLPFLAKPFSARELTQIVQQTLRAKQVPLTLDRTAETPSSP